MDYHNEPLLILFGFLLITNFLSKLVYKFTYKDSTTMDMGSEKTEDVKFINVLGQLQRQMLINSERRNREKWGFKKLDDEFYRKIQEIKVCHSNCKTALLGIHTYSILDNIQYQSKFQYIPLAAYEDLDNFNHDEIVAKNKDKDKLIEDHDFVYECFNSVYL